MQAEIMQAICEHAAAEYPNESCGFVVQNGRKARYLPCRNVAENALDNFVISPQEYAQAEDQGEIIRIIHSHPDVPVFDPIGDGSPAVRSLGHCLGHRLVARRGLHRSCATR
ncbi:Uncharacterised protein [Serratia fonticola]|uniref:JAB domain-containing protein n=1 Tax=Serratia fonticola TaxID=47917 RepID=A0A4V6Z3B6_SERFO|nr:Uncharacterised protein [Serratia fonticola]